VDGTRDLHGVAEAAHLGVLHVEAAGVPHLDGDERDVMLDGESFPLGGGAGLEGCGDFAGQGGSRRALPTPCQVET
jgi:hypothetical protein